MPLSDEFNRLQSSPARRFEAESGLAGISASYKIPDGLSPLAYENLYIAKHQQKPGILKDHALPPEAWLVIDITAQPEKISPLYAQKLREGWDALRMLNPALENVKADKDDLAGIAHALAGATSGFNADDINFYLSLTWDYDESGEPTGASNLPAGYEERLARVESLAGASFSWYPAPATLGRIEAQLNKKTPPAPPLTPL